jgi:hypothetical protein
VPYNALFHQKIKKQKEKGKKKKNITVFAFTRLYRRLLR